jgi:asparagine N-glycosylation enzyme membrane subunit Stt3
MDYLLRAPLDTPVAPSLPPPATVGTSTIQPSWLREPWTDRRTSTIAVALLVLVIVAAVCRVRGLDYGGFSEDEVNKVLAVEAYRDGRWSANAEHPMVMKLMMWASLAAADRWNVVAAHLGAPAVSVEAALRLPNALAGALAVVPLFLFTRSLVGTPAGMWAAGLFALDIAATGINRIGKEDSLLLLFLLIGAWLYEEARIRHVCARVAPHRWYAASGAAFGLMVASKYMPYYLGLWGLAGLAASAEARRITGPALGDGFRQRASRWFYVAGAVAFVLANPAILLPDTWRYLLHYVHGGTVTHHGTLFAGQLYVNTMGATPWGLPWSFYLVYLVTKIPLPVLGAILVGIVELVRRRRERGPVFLRVFLLFFLLPSSLAAAKFARYLLPTLVMLDIVAALGAVRLLDAATRIRLPVVRRAAMALLVGALAAIPAWSQVASSPFQSMHQNALGRAWSAGVAQFPNDELYDLGMREAVAWIAQRAAPGASVASDAPGVVGYYLRRYHRPDIEARSLSMEGVARPPTEAWVLAQDSHACFESEATVEQLRAGLVPEFVARVREQSAVETFRLQW